MRKAGIAIGASAGAVVARAGGQLGGRRNKQNTQPNQPGSENENSNNTNNNNTNSNSNRSNSNSPIKKKQQQQQTPDEAALTAKNYRLAKELVSFVCLLTTFVCLHR